MNMRKRNWLMTALWGMSLLSGVMAAGVAAAADGKICPSGPVQLIVPFPAGGGTDLQGRIIADPLAKRLGKQVVVINRPGASGIVGEGAFVRNAKPDGCMLVLATGATNAAAPYLYKDFPFDPMKDFTPIAFVAAAPNVLYVNSKSKWRTAQDFIADARAHPGKFTYASGGTGTSSHLAGVLLAQKAGLNLVHVPYQGAAPALSGLMGGQVDIDVDTAAQISHVRSGSLRALAVASLKRLQALPDVPTFDEVGVKGVQYAFWGGIAGPKNMPASIVDTLNEAINDVLREPKVHDYFINNGGQLSLMTPAQFKAFWMEELARNKEIITAAGIKPN